MSDDEPELMQVLKISAYLPISDELLADTIDPGQHVGPIPRPPLLRRLRWRWQDARERLGELVAGRRFDVDGGDW